MAPDAWIPITVLAALLQNLRSYLQKGLIDALSVHGAAFVRFGYALPFAWAYVLGTVDAPFGSLANSGFWFYCVVGGLSQIVATACLLASFSGGHFGVGTVLSKTEAAQAALFGALLIGDVVTPALALGVGVSFAGVLVLSLPVGVRVGSLRWRTLALGVLSGSAFAIAAVGFRAAALALPDRSALEAAAITLGVVLTLQTVAYGAFLALRERASLRAVIVHWRRGLQVGMSGMAASACWFTAMAMVSAAAVRTLGQVELLFTLATSAWLLGERVGVREMLGGALVAAGVLFLTLGVG